MTVQMFVRTYPHTTMFLPHALVIYFSAFFSAFFQNPMRTLRIVFTLFVALPVSVFLMVTSKIIERFQKI